MNILNVPKAVYKAQQAKKKMSQIQVAGVSGNLSLLVNGLNEIEEIEVDYEALKNELNLDIDDEVIKQIVKNITKNAKSAFADARKQLEKELMNSTNLDDLKSLLG